ncbi:hypothetical protein ANO14919_066960 [Xylariales sp. No.14919]|nr:hypothetical protein ANO14919_066960 [Xylariales sp. No.14919]
MALADNPNRSRDPEVINLEEHMCCSMPSTGQEVDCCTRARCEIWAWMVVVISTILGLTFVTVTIKTLASLIMFLGGLVLSGWDTVDRISAYVT